MKAWSKCLAVCMLTITLASTAMGAERPPEQVKTIYQKVAANLETGGDFYWIGNVDGLVDRGAAILTDIITAASSAEPNAARIKEAAGKLAPFLKRNGFCGAQAIGISAVPRGDGLHKWKFVLLRDQKTAQTPLWRGLFGGAPHKLAVFDYIPADAAVACAGDADISALWKILREGIRESGSYNLNRGFEQGLASTEEILGVSLDKLIESFGTEAAFALTLANDAQVTFPMPDGGEPLVIPEPGLLIVLQTKDDTLYKLLEAQLANTGIPIGTIPIGDVQVRALPIPLPLPVALQLAYARDGRNLIIGLSTKVVSAAVNAAKKQQGLATTAEFKKAFADLPMVNNGISYVSPRFSSAMSKVQKRIASGSVKAAQEKQLMDVILGAFSTGNESSAYVSLNKPDGVVSLGVSSTSGRKLLGSVALLPAGIMAGVAIPAFVQSRETASGNACANNLRLIDAAKEQYAMEQDAKGGDPAPEEAIAQYLKGNKIPTCPQGGRYTINKIGEKPACSYSQHEDIY